MSCVEPEQTIFNGYSARVVDMLAKPLCWSCQRLGQEGGTPSRPTDRLRLEKSSSRNPSVRCPALRPCSFHFAKSNIGLLQADAGS